MHGCGVDARVHFMSTALSQHHCRTTTCTMQVQLHHPVCSRSHRRCHAARVAVVLCLCCCCRRRQEAATAVGAATSENAAGGGKGGGQQVIYVRAIEPVGVHAAEPFNGKVKRFATYPGGTLPRWRVSMFKRQLPARRHTSKHRAVANSQRKPAASTDSRFFSQWLTHFGTPVCAALLFAMVRTCSTHVAKFTSTVWHCTGANPPAAAARVCRQQGRRKGAARCTACVLHDQSGRQPCRTGERSFFLLHSRFAQPAQRPSLCTKHSTQAAALQSQ